MRLDDIAESVKGRMLGSYIPIEVIAKGGMAVVMEANLNPWVEIGQQMIAGERKDLWEQAGISLKIDEIENKEDQEKVITYVADIKSKMLSGQRKDLWQKAGINDEKEELSEEDNKKIEQYLTKTKEQAITGEKKELWTIANVSRNKRRLTSEKDIRKTKDYATETRQKMLSGIRKDLWQAAGINTVEALSEEGKAKIESYVEDLEQKIISGDRSDLWSDIGISSEKEMLTEEQDIEKINSHIEELREQISALGKKSLWKDIGISETKDNLSEEDQSKVEAYCTRFENEIMDGVRKDLWSEIGIDEEKKELTAEDKGQVKLYVLERTKDFLDLPDEQRKHWYTKWLTSIPERRRINGTHKRAIKILDSRLVENQGIVDRFKQEIEIQAQKLNHRNLVKVVESGEGETPLADGSCVRILYSAMEFVDAIDLENDRVSTNEATYIIKESIEGLIHAHENGVLHRDLKPSNILYGKDKKTVKITDFGIAKKLQECADKKLTETGMFLGSPSYIDPERARAHEADERSDVYSLGATFYKLLTGKPPIEGEDHIEIIGKIARDEDLEWIRRLNPEVSEELEDVAMMMLSKDKKTRLTTEESRWLLSRSLNRNSSKYHAPNEHDKKQTAAKIKQTKKQIKRAKRARGKDRSKTLAKLYDRLGDLQSRDSPGIRQRINAYQEAIGYYNKAVASASKDRKEELKMRQSIANKKIALEDRRILERVRFELAEVLGSEQNVATGETATGTEIVPANISGISTIINEFKRTMNNTPNNREKKKLEDMLMALSEKKDKKLLDKIRKELAVSGALERRVSTMIIPKKRMGGLKTLIFSLAGVSLVLSAFVGNLLYRDYVYGTHMENVQTALKEEKFSTAHASLKDAMEYASGRQVDEIEAWRTSVFDKEYRKAVANHETASRKALEYKDFEKAYSELSEAVRFAEKLPKEDPKLKNALAAFRVQVENNERFDKAASLYDKVEKTNMPNREYSRAAKSIDETIEQLSGIKAHDEEFEAKTKELKEKAKKVKDLIDKYRVDITIYTGLAGQFDGVQKDYSALKSKVDASKNPEKIIDLRKKAQELEQKVKQIQTKIGVVDPQAIGDEFGRKIAAIKGSFEQFDVLRNTLDGKQVEYVGKHAKDIQNILKIGDYTSSQVPAMLATANTVLATVERAHADISKDSAKKAELGKEIDALRKKHKDLTEKVEQYNKWVEDAKIGQLGSIRSLVRTHVELENFSNAAEYIEKIPTKNEQDTAFANIVEYRRKIDNRNEHVLITESGLDIMQIRSYIKTVNEYRKGEADAKKLRSELRNVSDKAGIDTQKFDAEFKAIATLESAVAMLKKDPTKQTELDAKQKELETARSSVYKILDDYARDARDVLEEKGKRQAHPSWFKILEESYKKVGLKYK